MRRCAECGFVLDGYESVLVQANGMRPAVRNERPASACSRRSALLDLPEFFRVMGVASLLLLKQRASRFVLLRAGPWEPRILLTSCEEQGTEFGQVPDGLARFSTSPLSLPLAQATASGRSASLWSSKDALKRDQVG